MVITTTSQALLRLLQLSSPSLPIGAYAFSHGMENAVDIGWISDISAAEDWLAIQMTESLGHVDLPIIFRMLTALEQDRWQDAQYWNDFLMACRETKELRLSDTAMGYALSRVLRLQGVTTPKPITSPSFLLMHCFAAHHWGISQECTALAYMWSWLENQVVAATKLIPLGQTQAQQLLNDLQQTIPDIIAAAKLLHDDDIGSSLPALAIASANHETQYSRLFRS